jgi:hypothetical protein
MTMACRSQCMMAAVMRALSAQARHSNYCGRCPPCPPIMVASANFIKRAQPHYRYVCVRKLPCGGGGQNVVGPWKLGLGGHTLVTTCVTTVNTRT